MALPRIARAGFALVLFALALLAFYHLNPNATYASFSPWRDRADDDAESPPAQHEQVPPSLSTELGHEDDADPVVAASPPPERPGAKDLVAAALEAGPSILSLENRAWLGTWEYSAFSEASFAENLAIYYGITLNRPAQCHVPRKLGETDDNHANREKGRFSRVAKYSWRPEYNPLFPFIFEDFVGRFITAPRGLVIIGDDLAYEQYLSLTLLLRQPRSLPQIINTKEFAPDGTTVLSATSRLNMARRFGKSMLATHGGTVPLERWKLPIVRYYRTELWAPGAEGSKPLDEEPFWNFLGTPASVDGWPEIQDDVVVISSGKAWSPSSTRLSEDETLEAYSKMTESLIPRLLALPRTVTVVRSISIPSPKGCDKASEPLAPEDVATDHVANAVSWASKEDAVMRAAVDETVEKGEAAEGEGKRAKAVFMDIREMTSARPDAHSNEQLNDGTIDCDSWCAPIMPYWWNRLLWDIARRVPGS